ncbi:hypothetical protein GP475_00945 [Corynebacterium poyangense]|uniref:Phage holin family protein n=1 Tax=Corynebacterium poyangense TaxID=2684405 RepID=A0A7H0SLD3_9CORY|nr:phage holin family protein [Corynebacterium poyangense]QNQ89358.1 hypothetical protein GP475_00945 [Corynebacterium poyangense]
MRFLWNFLLHTLVIAIGMYVVLAYVPGISLRSQYHNPWTTLLVAAAVWTLINSVLATIVRRASLPLRILTLGLFSVLLSLALLGLSYYALEQVGIVLVVQSWLSAAIGLAVLSIVSSICQIFIRPLRI